MVDASEVPRRRVMMVLAVGIAAIAFAAIFFRNAQPTHPLASAGIRLCIASVLLLPLSLRARLRGRLPNDHLRAGLLAGLCYAAHFGAWVTSLEMTSVAASVTSEPLSASKQPITTRRAFGT